MKPNLGKHIKFGVHMLEKVVLISYNKTHRLELSCLLCAKELMNH